MHKLRLMMSLFVTPLFIYTVYPCKEITQGEEKTVEFQQLRDNIYMVVDGWPLRITLSVGNDGILIVDANPNDNVPLVYPASNNKFDNRPIKYVISSDSHRDHASGTAFLIGQVLSALRIKIPDKRCTKNTVLMAKARG